MEKKLYFNLDDGNTCVTMELSGCVAWIEGDGLTEETSEDREYILTPIWLTEEEFNNLPEAEV